VPGSGKTYLIGDLKAELRETYFAFYEGSETISRLVPGGLEAFYRLDEEGKTTWRNAPIAQIGEENRSGGKAAIVAGHYMFWTEDKSNQPVWTHRDQVTFIHILYLDVPIAVLRQHRLDNIKRGRPKMSAMHLPKWQDAEKSELRGLCAEHGILYSVLPFAPMLSDGAARLIENFRLHTEDENIRSAEERLDTIVENPQGPLEKMLVMDADRTLSATDTGDLFRKHMVCLSSLTCVENQMKTIFSSLHYSHTAFR
jgi:hypothetical protein